MQEEKTRYPQDWELLTANSGIVLAGRLKILWEYVICGKRPLFTLEAWVSPRNKGGTQIGNLRLFVRYDK